MPGSTLPAEGLQIVSAKLRLPRYRLCLPRPRLFAQLDRTLNKPLVLLCADGGYGKTALVANYLAARRTRAVWYSLDPLDASGVVFACYCLQGMADLAPVVNTLLPRLRPDSSAAELATALRVALAALQAVGEEVVIVLDDFHRIVGSPEVPQLVDQMLADLPANVHLLLIGRHFPHLPLVRYRLREQVAELGRADLAFTLDETRELMRLTANHALDPTEVELLHEQTEGWAVGLRLSQEALKGLTASERQQFWTHFSETPAVFDYLATEVLSALPLDLQTFLLQSSVLYYMEPSLVDELTGADGALARLRQLGAQNLFTTESAGPCFQYHPLLRKFLYRRLLETVGTEAVYALHRKAAAACTRLGRYDVAVNHYMAAGAYGEACRVLAQIPEAFHVAAHRRLMCGLVRDTTPLLQASCPAAFVQRAVPLASLESMVPDLENFVAQPSEPQRVRAEVPARYYLAYYRFQKGDFAAALALLAEATALSQRQGDWPMAGLCLHLTAMVHWHRGDLEAARATCQEQLALATDRAIGPLRYQALWTLGAVLAEQGRLREGQALVEGALEAFETPDQASRSFALAAAGMLRAARGDTGLAERLLAEARAAAAAFQIPADLGWTHLLSGTFELHRGRLAEAENLLTRAEAQYAGFTFLQCLTRIRLAHALLLKGEDGRAGTLLASALEQGGSPDCRQMLVKELAAAPALAAWAESRGLGLPDAAPGVPAGAGGPVLGLLRPAVSREPVPALSIQALGPLRLYRHGVRVEDRDWPRGSARRLFLLLVCRQGAPLTRATILDLLWPDVDGDLAHNRFYVALNALRKVLEPGGPGPGAGPGPVRREGDRYAMHLGHDCQLDLVCYQQLAAAGLGATMPVAALAALREAAGLYRGDLLADAPGEEFLFAERDRLRELQGSVLLRLAELQEERGEHSEALASLERAAALDGQREEVHRRMMEFHLRRGNRGRAMEVYRGLKALLWREYRVTPDPKTEALLRAVALGS